MFQGQNRRALAAGQRRLDSMEAPEYWDDGRADFEEEWLEKYGAKLEALGISATDAAAHIDEATAKGWINFDRDPEDAAEDAFNEWDL